MTDEAAELKFYSDIEFMLALWNGTACYLEPTDEEIRQFWREAFEAEEQRRRDELKPRPLFDPYNKKFARRAKHQAKHG